MSTRPVILSVGGSIIIPKTGFNIPFLKKFRAIILGEVRRGTRFILVIGGGATCRTYQHAGSGARPMTKNDLDWIGIYTTKLNAQFVRFLFKEHAESVLIDNPKKKVVTRKPILVGAGYEPGHSTDTDAVLLAETYRVTEICNLSNIDFVYTKDPTTHPDAQKITTVDWATFRRSIAKHPWDPGLNSPFDPIASEKAEALGLTVRFVNGMELFEVKKAIQGKPFRGTIIHP